MSRRVTLPGADELFGRGKDEVATDGAAVNGAENGDGSTDEQRRSSGRVRHDEKITVYVTSDELLDLEDTRLTLRREHGLAVDRGRIVREAIRLALDDAAERGGESALVGRLLDQ